MWRDQHDCFQPGHVCASEILLGRSQAYVHAASPPPLAHAVAHQECMLPADGTHCSPIPPAWSGSSSCCCLLPSMACYPLTLSRNLLRQRSVHANLGHDVRRAADGQVRAADEAGRVRGQEKDGPRNLHRRGHLHCRTCQARSGNPRTPLIMCGP